MFVGSVLSMGHDEFHVQIHTYQFLIEMQVRLKDMLKYTYYDYCITSMHE